MAEKRVVIVDDTMSVGRFLQAALTTLGGNLNIAVVPSAEEAILEAGHFAVDLIITDINLPGISGVELARKVRTRFPSTKVVLISGMSDIPIAQYTEEVGAAGYFLKPLDTAQFLQTARRLLDMEGQSSQLVEHAAQKIVPDLKPASTSHSPAHLPNLLAGYRQRLGAQAAMLLEENGRIVAQAGDLPSHDFENNWVPTLMGALSANAKAAHLLGGDSCSSVVLFKGDKITLALAPVGDFALVIVIKNNAQKDLRMSALLDEVQMALPDLGHSLQKMGLKLQTAEPTAVESVLEKTKDLNELPTAVEEAEGELARVDFSSIFEQEPHSLASASADDFWNLASAKDVRTLSSDSLTFEQARQLGLTPDDADSSDS